MIYEDFERIVVLEDNGKQHLGEYCTNKHLLAVMTTN